MGGIWRQAPSAEESYDIWGDSMYDHHHNGRVGTRQRVRFGLFEEDFGAGCRIEGRVALDEEMYRVNEHSDGSTIRSRY